MRRGNHLAVRRRWRTAAWTALVLTILSLHLNITLASASAPLGALTMNAYGQLFASSGSVSGNPTWSWRIARGLVVRPNTSAGYTLDGFGGIHPFGGAPGVTASAYWPGWDIARGIALNPCDSGATSGYVLDGFGGLHPFGGAPDVTLTGYWRNFDIAVALALNDCSSGHVNGYVLDGFGGLHPFWQNGSTALAQPTGGPYWPGWNIARGIAITAKGQGEILDGYGHLHPFGGAPSLVWSGSWGWDIARALVYVPALGGGYVLDGWGGVHAYGSAPAVASSGWTAGSDIFRAIAYISAAATPTPTPTPTPIPGGTAANVFVSTSGSDSGAACTRFASATTTWPSAGTACATVSKALSLAQPGDIVQLEPGSYGDLTVNRQSGADTPRIVIRGDPNLVDQQDCVEDQATFLSSSPLCAHGNVLISGLNVCGHGVTVENLDTVGLSTTFYIGDNSCPDTNHVTDTYNVSLINSHFTYQSTIRCHDCSLQYTRIGPNEQICDPSHSDVDGDNLHVWPDAGSTPWTVPYNVTLDHNLIYDAVEQGAPHGCGWGAHTDLVQTLGYSNLVVTNNILFGCVDSAWQDGTINGTTIGGATLENNFINCHGQNGGGGTFQLGSNATSSACPAGNYLIENNTWSIGASPSLSCNVTTTNVWRNNFIHEGLSLSYTCGSGSWDHNAFDPSGTTCGTSAYACTPGFLYPTAGTGDFAHGWDLHITSNDTCLRDRGTADLATDFDGQERPQGTGPDIGADEVPARLT